MHDEHNTTRRGYIRVSTADQNIDLQRRALEQAGVDVIYTDEGISGAATSRPQLDRLLEDLQPGDQLVVWRLDRLGRSSAHLAELLVQLQERGVEFCSCTEGIDTTTPGGRLVYHVFAAVAQFEREIIRERVNAGIAAAKARGQHCGRRPSLSLDQARLAQRMIDEGASVSRTARQFKVSRTTLRRSLNRLQQKHQEPPGVLVEGTAGPG